MQYHFNGFISGDPSIKPVSDEAPKESDNVDVLIVGCGPAGLTLASQLAQIDGVSTRIFDQKAGPLEVGQADGVACRSMEMFEAFGFVEKVLKESYWVNETSFWRPQADGTDLARADRIQDVEDDLSHMPHVILNQARIHDFFLEVMRNSSARLEPNYNRQFSNIQFTNDTDYPLKVTFECLDADDKQEIVNARYMVGCDGARSDVRKSLGLRLEGEAARQLWGVMDVLAVTDFPDIRLKCVIQSAAQGSILVIPREGGHMVRLYIELDELHGNERASDRNVTPELLIEKAKSIIAPYSFDVKEVAWWSAYEIGQRVCNRFDDVADTDRDTQLPRVFIAGDACHTHSPKAGQGMNVSMADAFNLGWKLASVIRNEARPELLHTYSQERQTKAVELIEFDRDMARLFSEKPKTADAAKQFQRYFQKHGRYTAGVETTYSPSHIVGNSQHQSLAAGQKIGKRFHSAPVIRLADAKPIELAETLVADGRWRLFAFADQCDTGNALGKIGKLCGYLESDAKLSISGLAGDAQGEGGTIELNAIFQQSHRTLNLSQMPALLLPPKGKYGLTDYEKMFCVEANKHGDIFDLRGIDRKEGALIIVRPDQFIAQVLPLDAHAELLNFFRNIFMKV